MLRKFKSLRTIDSQSGDSIIRGSVSAILLIMDCTNAPRTHAVGEFSRKTVSSLW